MTLRLRFQTSGAQPGARAAVEMTGGVLTVGRGEENDLTLPDPERTLSKRHCVIEARGGDYVVVDLSTNGTFLNYAPERLGDAPTPLDDGDVIGVGGYELVVEIEAEAPEAADPLAAAPPPAPLGESPLDALGGDGDDFLDDILGGPPARPAPPPAWGPPRAPAWDDPLAEPGPSASGWGGASAADHSPAAQDHFQAPRAAGAVIPEDWDDLFETPPAGPASAPEAAPAPLPAPAPASAPGAPRPPQPASPAPGDGGREAAARAFLAAAGMGRAEIPDAELAETMARMGRVFAAMVGGLRDILLTRASIKGEMRMDRTMISMGGNNPLKFSVSAEQAVEAMIRPSAPGYLEAEAAAREALDDVKAHEVAMMSGMQAALKDLLARLGPDALARRIETGSSLGGLLGGKKARYWEAYERMYAQIARETEDDFQSTFGKEFARAYAAQLRTLEDER
ncbi:type VI secretion system-associated FHA domain protein TagH [Albimonas pacifica]|uniref:FHA domain protein n=1 Tax=Albimonas pacifica TaxID=1114924 RepID=A0A1I3CZV0_9RHOB|nr:type VI secretion system-associated FHA domain protein TagH [Albimonas pacifica]SFH79898.1 FHA domain protein [Albimonas pacifica]